MKITGYTLITVAFLAGAYFAVLPPYPLPVAGDDANQVPWGLVGSMLLLGAIGVALARRGSAAETQHEGTLTSNIEAVNRSLESIVTKVTSGNLP